MKLNLRNQSEKEGLPYQPSDVYMEMAAGELVTQTVIPS